MFVAQLPGSMYPTETRNAGPRNGTTRRALFRGELLGRVDARVDVEVAFLRAPEHREPLRAEPELLPRLRARRDVERLLRAADERHVDLVAERGLRERER